MTGAAPVLTEYPKTVVLKDGAHLVLRPADAAEPDPVAALTASWSPAEQPLPEPAADAEHTTVLALDGERVVGAAVVARLAGPTATVTVAVDGAYRGRRLGTWLLLDAVHLAAGLGVGRLLAVARADDEAYLGALRRLDFFEAGNAPGAGHGRPSDGRLVLAKTLHGAWTDF
jgi:GNAT superfamily N-acetyltransferase